MNANGSVSAKNDWGMFLATLGFFVPPTVALLCALALSRGINWYPASAMWFMYQATRLISYLGFVVYAGLILGNAVYHTTSRKFLVPMGLSLAGAAVIVWYAMQVFKDSW